MPQQTHSIVRFFRELRRRRVIKTFAMYGATAFILMEAADIMLPRLGLPEWTVTFVIVLLITGFPIALVLSWIFDVTPEGIQKTPAEAEAARNPEPGISVRKKGFTVSHAVIIVLLAAVCILLYPKLFPGDRYRSFRNEAGQISLVVLPFENQTGDSGMDWFSKGISSLLTNGLGSSDQLLVYNDQGLGEIMEGMKEINTAGITGAQARDIAGKVRTQTFITGSFQGRGDNYRILASLVSTENGDILFTRQVEGSLNSDAYLDLADSLCNQIRDRLEIRALEQQADFDFRKAFTASAEAYRHYIEGMNTLVRADFDYAVELLEKAMAIDSTFAFAAFSIAMAQNFKTSIMADAEDWIARAHQLKSSLPMLYQQWIDLWHICAFEKDLPKLQRQLSVLESAGIESRLFWFDIAVTHRDFTGNLDRSLEAFRKVAEISEKRGEPWRFWRYYIDYGTVLRETGRYQEEEALYRQGLEIFSEERYRKEFYYNWTISAVSRGDSALASRLMEEYRKTKEILGELQSYEYLRGLIYYQGKDFKRAEAECRSFLQKYPDNPGGKNRLAMTLIEGELNPQEGLALIISRLEQYPENLFLLDWKAYALHKLGRHREALELFQMNDERGLSLNRRQWMQEVREALAGTPAIQDHAN